MHVLRNSILLVLVTLAGSTSASIGRFLPFSGFYPIPAKTPEPINIISGLTYPYYRFPPITFSGNNGQEDAYLLNTGTAVIAVLKNNYTTNIVRGGPLGKSTYTYLKTVFHWTNNTNGAAYTTVNGKNGSPLDVLIIFVNQKYKSYNKALKYRDGMFKVNFRIYIGSKPNPAFEPFAAAIKKIHKPGKVPINLQAVFEWYFYFPPNTRYFVYPGSILDPTTLKPFYCSTSVAPFFNHDQYISLKQFRDTFLKLRDSDGNKVISPVPQNPVGRRPVALSLGLVKKPTLDGKTYPSIIGTGS